MVRSSQSRSSRPAKKFGVRLRRPVVREAPPPAAAGRARAAGPRPRRRSAAASRPARAASSGPGPPLAAPEEVTTSVRPSVVATDGGAVLAEHPVGDQDGRVRARSAGCRPRRGSRSAARPPGSVAEAPRRELAGRALAGVAVGVRVVLGGGGDVDVAVRQREDLVARDGRRAAGRARPVAAGGGRHGPRVPASSCVRPRAPRRRCSSCDGRGARATPTRRRPRAVLVALADRRGRGTAAGCRPASRRTASTTAGSTSQLTEREPAVAPRSTSERSAPPAGGRRSSGAESAIEPSAAWASWRRSGMHQRGVDRLPGPVRGPAAGRCAPGRRRTCRRPRRWRRARARRTSRRPARSASIAEPRHRERVVRRSRPGASSSMVS